jgi:hypothetical protein
MAPRAAAAAILVLAAAVPAGCGAEDGSARAVADLRSKADAQAAEIEALRREVADLAARARLLEERAASATGPAGPAAPAAAGPGPAGGAPDAAEGGGIPAPADGEIAEYLATPEGRKRIEDAVTAVENRRREEAAKERRDRLRAMIEERVKGQLAERLGLDSQQQQTLIRVSTDAAERYEEVWSTLRDARNDPAAITQAREKAGQIRADAMNEVQQALTVDQYNKLQEVMAEGGMGGFLGGGRGFGGPGGGGGNPTPPPGGAR